MTITINRRGLVYYKAEIKAISITHGEILMQTTDGLINTMDHIPTDVIEIKA